MDKETKQVLIRISVPLLKKVDAVARAQKRSRTAQVSLLLNEALRSVKKKGAEA